MSHQKFQECIEACLTCATECEHCATECLNENDVKMLAKCIQLDRDCAAVCFTAAKLMAGGSQFAAEYANSVQIYAIHVEKNAKNTPHIWIIAECVQTLVEAVRKNAGKCPLNLFNHYHIMKL